MPVFDSRNLLVQLDKDVHEILNQVNTLKSDTSVQWNQQPAPGKWSPVQIIEHLNSYNRYYLPQLYIALETGKANRIKYNSHFKSGWFGNYFTKLMLPGKDGRIGNKMNAPKDHNPQEFLNADIVLDEFVKGEQQLLVYLKLATETDIAKLKVPISISRFIKLKIGDTFRFLIAHQQRHAAQLKSTLDG